MDGHLISISGSSARRSTMSTPDVEGPLSYLRGMIRRDSSPWRVARCPASHTATFHRKGGGVIPTIALGGNIRRDVRGFLACHPSTTSTTPFDV